MRNRIPCQRDARTQLATALRRRPFSACNKGNRRRLHVGNIFPVFYSLHLHCINPCLTLEIQRVSDKSLTHSSIKNEFIPVLLYHFKSTYLLITASDKRSPQTILGQRHIIKGIARFFPIFSHSWDACVLHTNMHGMRRPRC